MEMCPYCVLLTMVSYLWLYFSWGRFGAFLLRKQRLSLNIFVSISFGDSRQVVELETLPGSSSLGYGGAWVSGCGRARAVLGPLGYQVLSVDERDSLGF